MRQQIFLMSAHQAVQYVSWFVTWQRAVALAVGKNKVVVFTAIQVLAFKV